MRRAVWLLIIAVTVGGLVFLFVLPGRTWLEQRGAVSGDQQRLQTLQKENAALAQQAKQLQSAPYLEQLARRDYGLIMPGEQAYGVLPPTPTTTTTTAVAGP